MPQITFRFGDFDFDPAKSTLKRSGSHVKLQPQPMRVLEMLLAAQGKIVTREQIRLHIWGESTYVDFEQGLNFAIRQIRIALEDTSSEPRYITTIPKQGYKFLASLPPAPKPSPTLWIVCASSAFLLIAAGVIYFRQTARIPIKVSKITSLRGNENTPAFSPDGKRLAFSWDGDDPVETPTSRSIFVMLASGGQPVRLTHNKSSDNAPSWSPDGNWIAFFRFNNSTGADLMLIPSIGGVERCRFTQDYDRRVLPLNFSITWTPDSKHLIFSSSLQSPYMGALLRLPLESGEPTLATQPPVGSYDSFPAVSPDGKWLAFNRANSPAASKIIIQPVDPSNVNAGPTLIPEPHGFAQSPVWLDHDLTLAYSIPGKIRIARWNRPPEDLHSLGSGAMRLSAIPDSSGRGFRLAAPFVHLVRGIYALPMISAQESAGLSPIPWIHSSGVDDHGIFSPDGKRIAFISNRTGAYDLWAADADGSHARQLTHLNATVAGFPAWSPDSKELVFQARTPTDAQIYRVSASGGTARSITSPGIDSISAFWPVSLSKLLFSQGHSPKFNVHSMSLDGGPAEQITIDGGIEPKLSADGKTLFYANSLKLGLYSRPWPSPSLSVSESIISSTFVSYGNHYHLMPEGLIFRLPPTSDKSPATLHFYRFSDHSTHKIADHPFVNGYTMSLSPDSKTLLIAGPSSTGTDILSIEGGLPR